MSTYTLKCSDCGVSFDIEATIREKEESKGARFICPKCRSENVRQEFSVTNFIKNVFRGDEKKGGCCSDKNSCDIGCAPSKKDSANDGSCCAPKKSCCPPKKEGGSCC